MSKNWCIDVHFKNITSKFHLRHYPSTIPSAQFYCCFRPPKGRRSPVGLWSAVRCSASQNSNQFSVLGRAEYGWWAGSQLCLLFLFFLSGLMSPHRYRQIPENIALYYTPTKYRGKVNLHLEVNTERTPVLDELPRPRPIRVIVQI